MKMKKAVQVEEEASAEKVADVPAEPQAAEEDLGQAGAEPKTEAAPTEEPAEEQEPEAEEPTETVPEPGVEEMAANPTAAGGADVAGAIEHLQAALTALAGLGAEPEMEMEPVAELAEVAALQLAEAEAPSNRRAPLRMDVGIIRVGPGNKSDNHYYTAEMLARDGHVFEGVKMYTTDHREDERSVRTEVALLESVPGVQEFAEGQYLVGQAVVFNPDFAEDVRNRNDAGVLASLHCSILASGDAKPGTIDEHEYNIVQGITAVRSVDWVTQAGAGGHALQLSEAEEQPKPILEPEPETEPEVLDENAVHPVIISEQEGEGEGAIQSLTLAEVITTLGKTNLPAASVATLAEQQYPDEAAVQKQVTAEVARLKAAGSGQPLGIQSAPQPSAPSLAEIRAATQAVNQKWLGR